jgi:hypothetical protein
MLILWFWQRRLSRIYIHYMYIHTPYVTIILYLSIEIYVRIRTWTGSRCTHRVHGLATGLLITTVPVQLNNKFR